MSNYQSGERQFWHFTLTRWRFAARILPVGLVITLLSSVSVGALDQQVQADLDFLGVQRSESFESVRKSARKMISANFPDHTDKSLPKVDYQKEFARRGHVCDQVRKTLVRIGKQFELGVLPDVPNKSGKERRHRSLDFTEYEYDHSADFAKIWESFRFVEGEAVSDPAEQMRNSPNPRPQFSDFDSWLEQFNEFQFRYRGDNSHERERAARLSQNLALILTSLGPDFRTHLSGEAIERAALKAQLAFRQLLGIDLASAILRNRPSIGSGERTSEVIPSSALSRLISMAIETPEGRSGLASVIEHLTLGSAYFHHNQNGGGTPSYKDPLRLDLDIGMQIVLEAVAAGATKSSLENRFALLLQLQGKSTQLLAESTPPNQRFDYEQTKTTALQFLRRYVRALSFGKTKSNLFAFILRESQKILAEPNPFISTRRLHGATTSEAGAVLDVATATNMLNDLHLALGAEGFDHLDPDGSRKIEMEKKADRVMTCEKLFSTM